MLFELKRKGNVIAQVALVTAVLALAAFGAAVGAFGLAAVGFAIACCALAVTVWTATSIAPGEVFFDDRGFIVRTVRLGRERTASVLYSAIEKVTPAPKEGRVAITYRASDRRRTAVVWPANPELFAGEVEWRVSCERKAA
jgi:hypothetical protein